MLTTSDGPVVVSERSMRAVLAVKRGRLLPQLYEGKALIMARSSAQALEDVMPQPPSWLAVEADQPQQELPGRIADAEAGDAAALRLTLARGASLVMLEEPIKERAKLSFIKAEGALSAMVLAYRQDLLPDVKPMVKIWQALGYQDVLPPPEQLDALWRALDQLE